jgi:hypothetical protein
MNHYYHFTSWNIEQVKIGLPYCTSWEVSNYWSMHDSRVLLMEEEFRRAFPEHSSLASFWAEAKSRSQRQKEERVELIRRLHYDSLPSRRNCMFLCDSESNARAYAEKYGFRAEVYHLLELSIGSVGDVSDEALGTCGLSRERFEALRTPCLHKANPKFLDCNSSDVAQDAMIAKYWQGAETESGELTEMLFRGFYQVVRISNLGHCS